MGWLKRGGIGCGGLIALAGLFVLSGYALPSHLELATDGDWLRGHFEPRSWEWIDENQFVCRERSLSEDGGRLISREVVVHAEKGVIADQFYAERLYGKAEIRPGRKMGHFTRLTGPAS